MPTYNFKHPETGRNVAITGDTPPDEATVEQIFSQTRNSRPITVEIQGGGTVDFPEGTPPAEIKAAMDRNFGGGRQPAGARAMDVQAALRDGYSKEEIVAELGKRTGMDTKQALADGHNIDDVMGELSKRQGDKTPYITVSPDQGPQSVAEEMDKSPGRWTPEMLRNALPSRKTIVDFARPTVEGAGAVLGGIVGAGAGLGPGSLPGAVIGAGLGYAGGKKLMDFAENKPAPVITGNAYLDPFIQSGLDVGTGATMEMGGQIAGKAIGYGLNKIRNAKIPYTPTATRQKAAQAFNEIQTAPNDELAAVYRGNQVESDALRQRVNSPAQLTPGQATGNIRAGYTEQSLAAKDAKLAEVLTQQDAANLGAAVDNLTDTLGTAKPIPTAPEALAIGETQRGVLKTGRDASKAEVAGAYKQVPDYQMPSESFTTTAQGLQQEFLHPESQDAIETAVKVFQSKPPTTKSLIAFDQYLSDEIRQAAKQGNDRVAKVLNILKRGNGDTLQGLKGDFKAMGEAAQNGDIALHNGQVVIPSKIEGDLKTLEQELSLRQSQDAAPGLIENLQAGINSRLDMLDNLQPAEDVALSYGEAHKKALQHFQKYGTDTVKKVLAQGDHIGGGRVAPEAVPTRFFTQSGSRELVNTIGQQQAAEQMKPHITNIITGKALNPNGTLNIQKAMAVIRQNRATLDNLGLTDHAHEIIKGQIPATIRAELEAKGVDILGNPVMGAREAAKWVKSYAPALRQVYGNSSKEMIAMQDYAKMIEILSRNKNVSYAGGSTSIEKLMMTAPPESFAGRLRDNLGTTLAGSGIGLVTGGPIGALYGGAAATVAKTALVTAKQHQQYVAGELMRDAITNPSTARLLMDIGKGNKVKPADIHSVVKTLAGYTAGRPDNKEPDISSYSDDELRAMSAGR